MNTRYLISLPERSVRSFFAAAGGGLSEVAQVVLPRFVRRSRLYEATAKNALRVAVELVGGANLAADAADPAAMSASRVAVKKMAGNVVELGSVAAFGFSPLWLLAAASDVLNGTRVYMRTLEDELAAAGVLRADTHFASVDQLMAALEGTAGGTARLIDLPPLEIAELKRSIAELRSDVTSLPSPAEMGALFDGLVALARVENRSLLDLSTAVGLAFLNSAGRVGRDHVVTQYAEDWGRVRQEGIGAYTSRVARPYRDALRGHFNPQQVTLTERLPALGRRAGGWLGSLAAKVKQRARR